MNTAVNEYNYRFKLTDYSLFDRNRARKVAIYGRVSTEHEAQLSALENQLSNWRKSKRFPRYIGKRMRTMLISLKTPIFLPICTGSTGQCRKVEERKYFYFMMFAKSVYNSKGKRNASLSYISQLGLNP